MRIFYIVFTLLINCILFNACTQTHKALKNEYCINEAELSTLRSLGDSLGMKEYTICMLQPGIKKMMSLEDFNAMNNAHFGYLKMLADSGIISLLGIYTETNQLNSFVIFNSTDTVYVKSIMEKSPKVSEKIVFPNYYKWYGPVALTKLNDLHSKMMAK